jgi:hypothetical protein
MERRLLFCAFLVAAAGCPSPRQRVEITTTPPGATVLRIEGPAPGVPPEIAAVVTPSAAPAGEPVGTTPLVYAARGERPFRLRIALPDHAPREVAIPGKEIEARIAIALEPTGVLADEDAVLEALLERGPLGPDDLGPGAAAALGPARARAALERLLAAGLIDQVRAKPPVYDLGEKGIARLRERLGAAAVIERLAASRRELYRAGRRP